MASRREILQKEKLKEKVSGKITDSEKKNKYTNKTSAGFIKGAVIGGSVGLVLGMVFGKKLFFTVGGLLAGGYIAENLKTIKEKGSELKTEFSNLGVVK